MVKNVCVIGAGTMGNGIAHVFAQNGFNVTVVDVKEEQLQKAISTITKNIDRQVVKRQLNQRSKAGGIKPNKNQYKLK